MIEVKNLTKIYKPKKGVPVKALDGVNLKIEEKGMVFILGKSGSGKSTLLNLLGGLDSYDDGEIIVKGKSSKDFSQSEFDSYRNTYIGFIFQEYNILNEFNVGQNIALAMELQGKKATSEELNKLLTTVDLEGYASRKPNELSGGQKQRVAIARALIKEPEIIMADEPTGALDSNTGKQVFETLQKLSKEKLVLIVSHDREFAEFYGDRVIEMADGKIISDIIKSRSDSSFKSDGIKVIDDKVLHIKTGYKLTDEDLALIREFLEKNENDSIISIDQKANMDFKKLTRIDEEGNKESFINTTEEAIKTKTYNKDDFKLIKSKLPPKNAFKIGASGLKAKPFRLFMTILLSAIAFAMFGLADTLACYNKVTTTINSINDTSINYASIVKQNKYTPDPESDYFYYNDAGMSQVDINLLNTKYSNQKFYGAFTDVRKDGRASPEIHMYNIYDTNTIYMSYNQYYRPYFYGIVEVDQDFFTKMGYVLSGEFPKNPDEIVLTAYSYKIYELYRWADSQYGTAKSIKSHYDLIGNELRIEDKKYKIVGVVDTHDDIEGRYDKYKNSEDNEDMNFGDYFMQNEMNAYLTKGPHALIYTANGFVRENYMSNTNIGYGQPTDITFHNSGSYTNDGFYLDNNVPAGTEYTMLNKNANPTQLKDDEIILDMYWFSTMFRGDLYQTLENASYIMMDLVSKDMFNSYYTLIDGEIDYSAKIYSYVDYTYNNNGYYDNWMSSANKEDFECFKDATPEEIPALLETMKQDDNQKYTRIIDLIYTDVFRGYRHTLAMDYTSYYFNMQEDMRFKEEFAKDIYQPLAEKCRQLMEQYLEPNVTIARYDDETWSTIKKKLKVVGFSNNQNHGERYSIVNATVLTELKILGQEDAPYSFALSFMGKGDVENMVNMHYSGKEGDDSIYLLKNTITATLSEVNSLIETLSKVFLYIGIGFAVFASFMLMNFIAVSISYKKREIGILRAVGARSSDVFRIFFSESFIISCINWLLAVTFTLSATLFINNMLRSDYSLQITLLNFNIRQIILIFTISLVVAFIASFLPVKKIARKKPIDAIQNR